MSKKRKKSYPTMADVLDLSALEEERAALEEHRQTAAAELEDAKEKYFSVRASGGPDIEEAADAVLDSGSPEAAVAVMREHDTTALAERYKEARTTLEAVQHAEKRVKQQIEHRKQNEGVDRLVAEIRPILEELREDAYAQLRELLRLSEEEEELRRHLARELGRHPARGAPGNLNWMHLQGQLGPDRFCDNLVTRGLPDPREE